MPYDLTGCKVLTVDDDQASLDLLTHYLEKHYCTYTAPGGAEALAFCSATPPDLVLLDIMMPDMDGYEVCRRLKANPATQQIPVLFLSTVTDSKTKAFELGAVDYITKPFKGAEVQARVRTHLALKRAQEHLQNQNRLLEEKVRERTRELHETRLEIVYRLGRAAEYRDTETGMHIRRMSHHCEMLGRAAGLSARHCDLVLHASPMHDVGKIGIPDSILLKPDRLTKEEFEVIKTHTTIGAEILSGHDSPLLQMAQKIALTHHERWDGHGYPRGLAGRDIPIEGRITSICDVFDALTSARPYKKPWPVDEALAEIAARQGSQFDPDLTALFLSGKSAILAIKARFPDK